MIQDQLVVGQLYQIDEDVQGTYVGYNKEDQGIYFMPQGNSGGYFISTTPGFEGCIGFYSVSHSPDDFPIVQ